MSELLKSLGEWFTGVLDQFKHIGIIDVIDILIVATILYYVYKFIRVRRAGKLALGLVLLLIAFVISRLAEMYALGFILSNIFQVGILALVVLFQPELRAALEKVGAQPLKGIKNLAEAGRTAEVTAMISAVSVAASDLASTKTGAIIVIERSTKLGDIVSSGTRINSDVSVPLLKNIFFNKAPLHDGAVIISQNKIHSAGCFLPVSANTDIHEDLGTRHRAAIGMSENSDAISIVVSEETGVISIALEGELKRGFDEESLKNQLMSMLVTEPIKKFGRKNEGGSGK